MGKQAGCVWVKGMKEHSLEVNIHAKYNNSLCSIVDRDEYSRKSRTIQIFGTLTLHKCIKSELVVGEMVRNAIENMTLVRGEGGIYPGV